jgi:hypothetical protein
MRRSSRLLLLLLAAAPATASAFEAIDGIRFPSSGEFPAYPREAGTLPRNLWVQGGLLHDDNILRRDAGGEESETVARLGAGASVDARVWGRQSVHLEARGDAYKFQNFSELDHFAYGLLGEWRWELGNDLSGTLGYERRHFLVDLAERLSVARDAVTANHYYGRAGFLLTPHWRLRGGLDRVDLDRPEFSAASTTVTTAIAGTDYVTSLGNAIGIEVRESRGDAPVDELVDPLGVAVNNDFKEREIAGVLTYRPSDYLRVAARLGQTERTYTELPGRDFDGTTGRLDVEWRPGNKTRLAFATYRAPRSIIDVGASHVVVTGISFGPSWAPTAKLVFGARIIKEDREYAGDPGTALGAIPLREETVRAWRFTAGWELTRHYQLAAAFETGERRANTLGINYDFNTVMANLRYNF